jgi:hypothetical protein
MEQEAKSIEVEKSIQAAAIEKAKKEQAKKARLEASRQRIKQSEIDLTDVRYEPLQRWEQNETEYVGTSSYRVHKTHRVTARLPNRSAYPLTSITLKVRMYDREESSSDILGEHTVQIRVYIPPHQTRAIKGKVNFDDAPKLAGYAFTYVITEIRGNSGTYDDLFDDLPDDDDTPDWAK